MNYLKLLIFFIVGGFIVFIYYSLTKLEKYLKTKNDSREVEKAIDEVFK